MRFTIDLNDVIASDLKFLAAKTRVPGEYPVSVARFVTELIEAEVASQRLEYAVPGVDPPILTLEALRARPAELPEDVVPTTAQRKKQTTARKQTKSSLSPTFSL